MPTTTRPITLQESSQAWTRASSGSRLFTRKAARAAISRARRWLLAIAPNRQPLVGRPERLLRGGGFAGALHPREDLVAVLAGDGPGRGCPTRRQPHQ